MKNFYNKLMMKTRYYILSSSKKKADIVLLGDSNTLISYFRLMSKGRWSSIISRQLKLTVANLGKDGSTTREFLQPRALNKIKNLNGRYYIICFGINDAVKYSVAEFEIHTRELILYIQKCTNGIPILMTNTPFYYPPHLNVRCDNEVMKTYEDVKYSLCKELNIPLIDCYSRFDREGNAGNWDVRIRTADAWDDSLDNGKTIESKWFNNAHFNVLGNKIVAEEIVKSFKENILLIDPQQQKGIKR